MRRLLRESLLVQVLAASLALSAFIIVSLTTLFLLQYSGDFERQLQAQAENAADFLANQCQFAMLVGDRGELERLGAIAVADERLLFVELSDEQGGGPILVTGGSFPREAIPALPQPGIHSAAGHNLIEVTRAVLPARDNPEWEHGRTIPARLGVLRLGFSVDRERAAQLRIIWRTAALALTVLLITAGVQSVQLRGLLRPLQGLTDFTRRVGAGDLSRRAAVLRPDEVGRLTEAFNRMLEALSATTVSRNYVDAIIESIAESVIVIDREGRIRKHNRATLELLGYGQEELNLAPVEKICPAGARLSGTAMEAMYAGAGGKQIPVLLSVSPMRALGAGFDGSVWVAQDMTARFEVEQQLRRAKEAAEAAHAAKSAFLANMSHELRTPLTAILGYSQLLQDECQERAIGDIAADLVKIERSGRILLELLNQVLDLSKIEAGKMELHAETFDFYAVLQDVLTSVEPLASSNDNRVTVTESVADAELHTDLAHFRQSLMNLVNNACKFTRHGEVSVAFSREGASPHDWVVVAVKDTGIGISPEQKSRLFQEFSQGDASTTRKFGGTGLGLAISRKMCRMMGGDISVDSELGKGSTFVMKVPARLREPEANRANESEQSRIYG